MNIEKVLKDLQKLEDDCREYRQWWNYLEQSKDPLAPRIFDKFSICVEDRKAVINTVQKFFSSQNAEAPVVFEDDIRWGATEYRYYEAVQTALGGTF